MEGLVIKHKEAVLKRKRAEEEMQEAYDSLFEWNKEQLIQSAMQKMGDDVSSIEVTHDPRGTGIFSYEKINYTIKFKDGTVVIGDDHAAKFHVGDIVESFNRYLLTSGFKYKNKLKLPRERINKHLPAVIEFVNFIFEMSFLNIRRKTDDLLW